MDLTRRATDPEQLDQDVSEQEALRSLGDLRRANRYLGGQASLLATVTPLLEGLSRPRLLDVGCGSADIPAALGRRLGKRLVAVGMDRKLLHLWAAPRSVHRVVADVRHLPFAHGSFDVVTASLFLHHFDAHEVCALLMSLHGLARRALVVNDLRRAQVPYLFGRMFFPWIFCSPISVHDGLVSVRRAFTENEMRDAFEHVGIPVKVVRRFPYRLVAVADKRS